MNNRLLIFSLLLLPTQAQADAWPQRITFRRDIPEAAKRRIAPGAKSYFWGTFQLRTNGTLYGVSLHDPNWKGNYEKWYRGQPILLYADLLSLSNGQWKYFRRCSLSYRGFTTQRMQISMDILWLEPDKQQRPILRIKAHGYEAGSSWVNGAGDEVIVVFPQGLAGRYVVQTFSRGYWRASDTLGQDVLYQKTDERGLLQIETDESINDDGNPLRITLYRWSTKGFLKVSSHIRNR